jgi:hypothetical protein
VAIETRVVTPNIPGDLLTCDAPLPRQIVMDSDVADYLAQLYAFAAECSRKLTALREILNNSSP